MSQIRLKSEQGAKMGGGFNSILLRAVDNALVDTIGESAAKAVKFYVEVSVITKDPESFKAQLEKLFSGSDAGSKLIEEKIMETLASLLKQSHSLTVSVDKWKDADLRQFIEECKRQFILS
jgi:hypothetical protein